jgi:hypothetical protein
MSSPAKTFSNISDWKIKAQVFLGSNLKLFSPSNTKKKKKVEAFITMLSTLKTI